MKYLKGFTWANLTEQVCRGVKFVTTIDPMLTGVFRLITSELRGKRANESRTPELAVKRRPLSKVSRLDELPMAWQGRMRRRGSASWKLWDRMLRPRHRSLLPCGDDSCRTMWSSRRRSLLEMMPRGSWARSFDLTKRFSLQAVLGAMGPCMFYWRRFGDIHTK